MRQGILWSSFVFQVKLTCETKCLLLPLPPISQIISPKAPTLRESSFTFFGGTWLALEKLEGASTMNINFAVYCRQIYMVSLWCSLEVRLQSISVCNKTEHSLPSITHFWSWKDTLNKSKDFLAEWSFPYKQYLLQFWYFWSAEWRPGGHAHRIQIINQRMVVKWGGFILVLFVTLTVRNLVLKMIIAPADVWLLSLFVCSSLYWSFW